MREFCRISMEFIKKGSNPRMYTAAARELLPEIRSYFNPLSRKTRCGCQDSTAWGGGADVPVSGECQVNGTLYINYMIIINMLYVMLGI